MGVVDGLEPLVGGVLARDRERDVGEPGVGLGAVPVLDTGAGEHDGAGDQRDGVLPLLLVPAGAGRADEDLAAAAGGVVDVPVVAAAGLKADVYQRQLTLFVLGKVRRLVGAGKVA